MKKKKVELRRKLLKTGTSICIVLPSQLLKLKGWEAGDEVVLTLDDKGNFVIKG